MIDIPELHAAVDALRALVSLREDFDADDKGDPMIDVERMLNWLTHEDWGPDLVLRSEQNRWLMRWLDELARTEVARRAVRRAGSAMWSLNAADEVPLDLEIRAEQLASSLGAAEVVCPDDLRAEFRRVASRRAELRAGDFVHELLAGDRGDVPVPDPGWFEMHWQGELERSADPGDLVDEPDGSLARTGRRGPDQPGLQRAREAVAEVVPADSTPVLVAWTYASTAAVCQARTLRNHWELLLGGMDVIAVPADLAWIFCYFHHESLAIARARPDGTSHRLRLPAV